jgi:L-rhamnose mutarotase
MHRIAFKMKLHPGNEAEYQRRHETIWPELEALLKTTGIREYSIFLDEETHILFGVLRTDDPQKLDNLPGEAIMKKWWDFMKDLMDTNPDHSPVSRPLREVFYMA